MGPKKRTRVPEEEVPSVAKKEVKHEGDGELSVYERSRIENIRKNEAFLSSLGLDTVKQDIEASKPQPKKRPPTKKGVSSTAKNVNVPVRRSGRVTTEKLKSEIEELLANNKIEESNAKQEELDAMLAKQKEGTYEVTDFAGENTYERAMVLEPISLITSMDNKVDESDLSGQIIANILNESAKEVSLKATEETKTVVSANTTPATKKGKAAKSVTNGAIADSDVDRSVEINDYLTRMRQLSLHEEDVAKLTPSRITSVYVHPSEHHMIVMAGDKNGCLGIWNMNYNRHLQNGSSSSSNSKSDGSGVQDTTEGVYKYSPHISNIASIYSPPDDASKIYTVSYDSTVKYIDCGHTAVHRQSSTSRGGGSENGSTDASSFVLAFQHPESDDDIRFFYYTDSAFSPAQRSVCLVSRSDGRVSLIDFRASKNTYQTTGIVQENIKINSIQRHPLNDHLVITAGAKSGCIAINDLRAMPASGRNSVWKPVTQIFAHSKSINAAYVTPVDGAYLVSVSQDNTVRLMSDYLSSDIVSSSGAKSSAKSSSNNGDTSSSPSPHVGMKTVVIKHNNQTGRWLSTFRPAFDPKQRDVFILGSMEQPRRVSVFHCSGAAGADAGNARASENTSFVSGGGSGGGSGKGRKGAAGAAAGGVTTAAGGGGSGAASCEIVKTFQDSESLNSVCSRNAYHPTLDVIAAGNSSGRVHVFRKHTMA